MPAESTSAWVSIFNSPIFNSGSLNVQAFTVDALDPFNFDANRTISSATQDEANQAVFSESVNLAQVGILDSGIFAGQNASITVAQLGSTVSSATNVATNGNAYAGAVQNLEIPYNNQLPLPDPQYLANAGGGIINSGGYDPLESSWNIGGVTLPYSPPGYGASDIFIGRQGQINISVDNNVQATAQAADGVTNTDSIGDWGVLFGGNPLTANGGALAGAMPGNTYGIFNTSVFVGGGLGATNTLAANLTGNTEATALVGDLSGNIFNGGTGDALAQAGNNGLYGDQYTAINSGGQLFYLPGGGAPTGPMALVFGLGNTTVTGRATGINVAAEALTGQGDAAAFAVADQFGGITQSASLLDPSGPSFGTGLQILIGGNGNVTGVAQGSTNAVAFTEQGSAEALSQVNEVFGIVDNNNVLNFALGVPFFGGEDTPGSGSAVLIDGDGSIAAGASISSNAYAQTGGATDPSGGAFAQTDTNFVVGLSQGGIVDPGDLLFPASLKPDPYYPGGTPGVGIIGNANLRVFADSTQTATAVSDYSVDPSGFVDPLAISAEGDLVAGILLTDIVVGKDLTSLSVASQLNAQSNAFSGGDVATAQSGLDSGNFGIFASGLHVQGDANYNYNPSILPNNNYTLDPSRNKGPINVFAQTDLESFAGTSGLDPSGGGYASTAVTGIDSQTVGIFESFIDIEGDATLISQGVAQLGAYAGKVLPVDISGNVDTSANPVYAVSDAYAGVGGEDAGVAGILNSTIKIGDGTLSPGAGRLSTLVQGDAAALVSAEAVTLGTDPAANQADAEVVFGSIGIGLTDNVISIARDGNVYGTSFVGGSSQALNQGAQIGDSADASALIESVGIGLDDAAIDIGRNGSILGQAAIGGEAPYLVSATSSNGSANASGTFDVFGIDARNGAIVSPGALTGNVTGNAFANTVVNSSAEQGTSNAQNTVTGVGISVPTGLQMGTNSTITAVAQIYNQVTALNANGTATALANTTAIGLGGTPVVFNGGTGTVVAVAGGLSSATSGILAP